MFQSLAKIFQRKPKKFLGIDIGTSFIRVVEIGKKGNNYILSNYGELDESFIKGEVFRTSEKNAFSLSDKNIAEAINVILEEAEIETKKVSFSIPDFCSFFVDFELPIMDKKEIKEAISYQVKPSIPLPINEVSLDWLIIEGEPSKTPVKVLVAVVPNEVIAQYQKIAKLIGLELKFLESEVFALSRIISEKIKKDKIKKDNVIGLVDIGAASMTCSIIDEGVLKNSYSFNIGGAELTKIIDKSLDIDYNEAENLKRKYGLLENTEMEEFSKNVFLKNTFSKILTPLVDSMLDEIKGVFRSFYREEGKEIDKVVLAGGTSMMPGLKDYFKDKLNKEVERIDPFSIVNYPVVLKSVLKEIGPTYGVALGLSLKGFE